MIIMPNIDQHIWNLEYATVDILQEFQQTGSITISLNNEGPDADELGLYKLLDYMCRQFNIDKKLVRIHTANLLEQHSEYKILTTAPIWFVNSAQTFVKNNDFTKKNFNNIKHFGLFIGRSNWHRLWLAAELFNKYSTQTLQTFLYNPNSDFHKSHLGFDKLVNQLPMCDLESVSRLIASAPIELDSVDNFPIVNPAHLAIAQYYHSFLIELVCETYTSGNSFFPTEKTWRPIICKTPFITQGPVDFLKNLKRLGFKTFSQYWDESYDEDGLVLGTKTILNNVERLSKMSDTELQSMYNDMTPILEHNYALMLELNSKSFNIFQ